LTASSSHAAVALGCATSSASSPTPWATPTPTRPPRSRSTRVVADAAGNPVLLDVLGRLAELTKVSRAITTSDRQARATTLHDVRRLLRAIRARAAAGATQAMTDHLTAMRETARSMRPRDCASAAVS
jgi:hypothetical protein